MTTWAPGSISPWPQKTNENPAHGGRIKNKPQISSGSKNLIMYFEPEHIKNSPWNVKLIWEIYRLIFGRQIYGLMESYNKFNVGGGKLMSGKIVSRTQQQEHNE